MDEQRAERLAGNLAGSNSGSLATAIVTASTNILRTLVLANIAIELAKNDDEEEDKVTILKRVTEKCREWIFTATDKPLSSDHDKLSKLNSEIEQLMMTFGQLMKA